MSSPAHLESELEYRARRWRGERRKSIAVEGLVQLASAWGALWLIASLADSAFILPQPARWAAWSLLLFSGVAGGFFLILLPASKEKMPQALRHAAERLPDLAPYLVSSWELREDLGGSNTSQPLAKMHLDQTKSRLAKLTEASLFSPLPAARWRRILGGVFAAWLATAPWLYWSATNPLRILVPWRQPTIESLLDIEPGSVRVAWGSPVAISTHWHKPSSDSPELWLKTPETSWTRAAWDRRSPAEYSYQLASLVRPTRYQIRWRRSASRIYLLEPAPYPSLEDARVRIQPPGSRSAGETISLQEGAELTALKGSWVAVFGRASEPLSRAQLFVSSLPSPIDFKPKEGGVLEAGFPVSQDLEFYFQMASPDGLSDPHPVHYRLQAKEDQPPTAEILSPAFDLDISNKEALPITYEVRDDYGVASVELAYRTSHGPERRLRIASFDPLKTDSVGDYRWKLSELPVGETVDLWIRAVDASAMGPQAGLSQKRRLRIVDFEATHAEMEKRWMDAENRLAKVERRESEARRALESLAAASSKDSEALQRAERAQDQGLDQEWNDAARALSSAAQSAGQDPYANPGVADELRSLAEEFSEVGADNHAKAAQQTAQRDWAGAAQSRAALEKEARKARSLMAKGHGLQAMQDLWNSSEDMNEQGSQLSEALSRMAESGGSAGSEQSRALQQALQRIQDEMKALAKTIESMPKPTEGSAEDKRRKTIVIPLGAAQRAASALEQALRSGNIKEAARLAQQLSEELARVRRALSEAAMESAEEGGGEGGTSPSQEMESLMSAWQQALDGQSRSLGQARKLDESRVQSMLDEEKKLLRELAARQRAALDEAGSLGPTVPEDVEMSMRVVLGELMREEIKSAPELLQQITLRLQLLAASTRGSEVPRIAALEKEERAILEALKKGVPPSPMDSAQASAADSARRMQSSVRGQTAELEKRLRELAERTSAIPSKTVDSTAQAQGEQSQAERNLGEKSSANAVSHEQNALEILDRGLKEMGDALERQRKIESSMRGGFGSGGSGVGGMRRSSGADTGFVPLPSAEEYQPAPEIRKELRKSVQEPRPRAFDKEIKDYFKRISE